MVHLPRTWQFILQEIIKKPGERERLAKAIGVTPLSLTRWANKSSVPQRNHLLRLVQFAQTHDLEELVDALDLAYPTFSLTLKEDLLDTVPTSFFTQVLNICTVVPETLRFTQISELVLQQSMAVLDADNLGVCVILIICMPPRLEDGKIRTLRERVGKGTSPWPADLGQHSIFLGMESLAGYVIESCHEDMVPDLRENSQPFPVHRTDFEMSSGAFPIWFGGRIAGCLLASSTQPNYFTRQRLSLLGVFSDVMSLAIAREEFYQPSLVELKVMPNYKRQRTLLSTFQQRVSKRMSDAFLQREQLVSTDAEQQVWAELEGLFINRPYDPEEYPYPPRSKEFQL